MGFQVIKKKKKKQSCPRDALTARANNRHQRPKPKRPPSIVRVAATGSVGHSQPYQPVLSAFLRAEPGKLAT